MVRVSASPAAALPLQIDGLAFSYRAGRRAVDDVSLHAAPGTVHAILGPNGAGKSTTIACAVGLHRPEAGSVRIFGRDPVSEHTFTAGRTGVMLQDGGLPMAARPLAVLRHLARLYASPLDVTALAERLGITSFADRSIRRLSGGQRQRVGLAAALIGRPRLLFLDEPTAGLDPQAALVVHEVIAEQRSAGACIVLTTHDMDDAQQLADEVTVIDHGRVIAAGTPRRLMNGGGNRMLRIVTGSPLPAAVRERLDRFGTVDAREAETSTLILRGDLTPADLAAITALLAEHEISCEEFAVTGRTLNDVFLDLTGRSLR
ncbi:ABC transporter ATP-binding protein [Brevibacterium otitidis]|uniref:ABC transporter ATP-binding protein n=1 Tax=Brevibacterium otitidis TaxID=53364 RepID=A0ABV5X2M8_9MICO